MGARTPGFAFTRTLITGSLTRNPNQSAVLPMAERRPSNLTLAVDEDNRALWDHAAHLCNLPVSNWLKMVATKAARQVVREEDPDFVDPTRVPK